MEQERQTHTPQSQRLREFIDTKPHIVVRYGSAVLAVALAATAAIIALFSGIPLSSLLNVTP